MGFSTLDYAVLAAYLAGITIFGAQFRTRYSLSQRLLHRRPGRHRGG